MLAPAEASSNLARYDGVRYGMRADAAGDLTEMYERTRAAGFGAEVKRRIMLGTYALSSGYYDAYYGRAQRVRTKIADDFRAAFERFDLIATPTSPTVAFELGERTADPLAMYLSDYFTVPMSLAGIPAISIPVRPGRAGGRRPARGPAPGPAFSETLLDAAHALEGARVRRELLGVTEEEATPRRRGAATPIAASRRRGPTRLMGIYDPIGGVSDRTERTPRVKLRGGRDRARDPRPAAHRTKMFCGCELSFGDEPNVHTCPVCLAHPGVLPTINEQAVRYGLQIALALDCEIAPRGRSSTARTTSIPTTRRRYQISQYDIPLATDGRLGDVRIHRVHLEEDAAKLIHLGESGRIHGSGASLVDFNRGGTPLVEIVTEPDLRDAARPASGCSCCAPRSSRLGVSDVNMEEGSLRCDANISVRPAGAEELGTKTELKNMNSFRFIERGIAAELERQRRCCEAASQVEQETLHFDPRTGALTSLRSKEDAHDYRYFPEPDLVPLAPTEEMLSEAREALPELPGRAPRALRRPSSGCPRKPADQLAFDAELGAYFEARWPAPHRRRRPPHGRELGDRRARGRPARGRRRRRRPADSKVSPEALAALADMVEPKQVTRRGAARQVLATLVAEGGDPAEIVEREGLGQMSRTRASSRRSSSAAIEAEPEAAEKVRGGNMKAIGPLVGYVMRETKGRADGGEVTRLIREKLALASADQHL